MKGIGRQEMVAYADKAKQDQHQEEGEEDIDWSRFDPGPERRRKLQQRCRKAHAWCWRWPEAKRWEREWICQMLCMCGHEKTKRSKKMRKRKKRKMMRKPKN